MVIMQYSDVWKPLFGHDALYFVGEINLGLIQNYYIMCSQIDI